MWPPSSGISWLWPSRSGGCGRRGVSTAYISRPRAASPAALRWPAAALLVVTAIIHLVLFPSHAGLVDEASAHPKPDKPEATQEAPTPPPEPPVRLSRGRPEPPITPATATTIPQPHMSPVYVGWLFLLGAAVSLVAARRVVRDDPRWGWGLGTAVCLAMSAGLLAARTTGLPGGYSEGGSLEGHLSLAVQGLFLILAAWRLREHPMIRWG